MGAPPLPSSECLPVRSRHGKRGNVRIGVDVPAHVKDELIALAGRAGSSMSDQVRLALRAWTQGPLR